MGKNFMHKSGRFKISLAGQGSTKLEAVGKNESPSDTYLPQVQQASYAMSQMPMRPSLSTNHKDNPEAKP
jgi:hypothetical protein